MNEIKEFLKNATWNRENGRLYFSATMEQYTKYEHLTGADFSDDWCNLTEEERKSLIEEFNNI